MPPRERQVARTLQADVVHRVALSETESLLKLQMSAFSDSERSFIPFNAGAFAMIAMGHEADIFQMGRAYTPFSFQPDGSCWLYVKAVGRISSVLAHAPTGSTLELIGPLGLGWPIDAQNGEKKGSWHVLADAANLAPVLALATHPEASPITSLQVIGKIAPSPDQADHGEKWPLNLKPDLPLQEIGESSLDDEAFWDAYFQNAQEGSIAFCLGSPWLEKALAAAQARAQSHRVWVYLKPTMACGTGSCYGCVTEVCDGLPARVCWDGPVLQASRLSLAQLVQKGSAHPCS